MKFVYIVTALYALPAIAGAVVAQRGPEQIDDLLVSESADWSDQMAMGPNPGGLGETDDSDKATNAGNQATGNKTQTTRPPESGNTEATKVGGREPQR